VDDMQLKCIDVCCLWWNYIHIEFYKNCTLGSEVTTWRQTCAHTDVIVT